MSFKCSIEKNTILAILTLSFGFFSCGKEKFVKPKKSSDFISDNINSSKTNKPINDVERNFKQNSHNSILFSSHQRYFDRMSSECLLAKGEVNTEFECECTTNEGVAGVFAHNSFKNESFCVVPSFSENKCELNTSYFHSQISASGSANFLLNCHSESILSGWSKEKNSFVSNGLEFKMSAIENNKENLTLFFNWFEKVKTNNSYKNFNLWAGSGNGYTNILLGKANHSNISGLIDSNLFPATSDEKNAGTMGAMLLNKLELYEPNPSELSKLLIRDSWKSSDFILSPQASDASKTLNSVWKSTFLGVDFDSIPQIKNIISQHNEGCIRACTIEFTSPKMAEKGVQFFKTYSNGSVVHRWFQTETYTEQGYEKSILSLAPSSLPFLNIEVVFTNKMKNGNLEVEETKKAFNRLGDSLFGATSIIANESPRITGLRNSKNGTTTQQGDVVILCEPELEPAYFQTQSSQIEISFGPYSSAITNEGSYFGWLPKTAHDPNIYFNSLLRLPLGQSAIYKSGEHAASVLDAFKGELILHNSSQKAFIAPIARCASNSEYWAPALLNKAKVANLSYASFETKEMCSRNHKQSLQSLEKNILFVMAAGNSGKSSPDFICPQSLSLPNGIVVAGSFDNEGESRFSRINQSTYGVNYADISAKGISQLGDPGTSFAAPVVTAGAFTLSKEFQNLEPETIKKAILIGAALQKSGNSYIASTWVRAGAYDFNAAYKMAKCFSQSNLPNNINDNLVQSCIQNSLLESGELGESRFEILKSRGVF